MEARIKQNSKTNFGKVSKFWYLDVCLYISVVKLENKSSLSNKILRSKISILLFFSFLAISLTCKKLNIVVYFMSAKDLVGLKQTERFLSLSLIKVVVYHNQITLADLTAFTREISLLVSVRNGSCVWVWLFILAIKTNNSNTRHKCRKGIPITQ